MLFSMQVMQKRAVHLAPVRSLLPRLLGDIPHDYVCLCVKQSVTEICINAACGIPRTNSTDAVQRVHYNLRSLPHPTGLAPQPSRLPPCTKSGCHKQIDPPPLQQVRQQRAERSEQHCADVDR